MTLPDTLTMLDGSTFTWPHEHWKKAFWFRSDEDHATADGHLKDFIASVQAHWDARTIPTKFHSDEPWEKEYKDHSELAHDVMYPFIRGALMGIVISGHTGGRGSVVAIGPDGKNREYTKDGSEQVSLDTHEEERHE